MAGDGALDVNELLDGYLRRARRAGAEIRCSTEVTGLVVEGGRCTGVRTCSGEIRAERVVNAAGAWASLVCSAAGATPVRLEPRRRSVITYAPPPGVEPRGWPFVKGEAHRVYLKNEAGDLLMSPMDETPVAPHDPHPDEAAVAEGVERLRALAPSLVPRAVKRSWAGLRTFAPDGLPVVGEDPLLPGLFWLAALGGTGIVTSPVIGEIAADLLIDGRTSRFDARLLSPSRFGTSPALKARR
jgi:D-arginine dehydrogenase